MVRYVCSYCDINQNSEKNCLKHEKECRFNPEVHKKVMEKINVKTGLCTICTNNKDCPMKEEETYNIDSNEHEPPTMIDFPKFTKFGAVEWCPMHEAIK